jgi:hypothetical protein
MTKWDDLFMPKGCRDMEFLLNEDKDPNSVITKYAPEAPKPGIGDVNLSGGSIGQGALGPLSGTFSLGGAFNHQSSKPSSSNGNGGNSNSSSQGN